MVPTGDRGAHRGIQGDRGADRGLVVNWEDEHPPVQRLSDHQAS